MSSARIPGVSSRFLAPGSGDNNNSVSAVAAASDDPVRVAAAATKQRPKRSKSVPSPDTVAPSTQHSKRGRSAFAALKKKWRKRGRTGRGHALNSFFQKAERFASHKKKKSRHRSAPAPASQFIVPTSTRRGRSVATPRLTYKTDAQVLDEANRAPIPKSFSRVEHALLKALWIHIAPDRRMTSQHRSFAVCRRLSAVSAAAAADAWFMQATMNRIVQHFQLIHDAVQRLRPDHPDVGLKKFICMRCS